MLLGGALGEYFVKFSVFGCEVSVLLGDGSNFQGDEGVLLVEALDLLLVGEDGEFEAVVFVEDFGEGLRKLF